VKTLFLFDSSRGLLCTSSTAGLITPAAPPSSVAFPERTNSIPNASSSSLGSADRSILGNAHVLTEDHGCFISEVDELIISRRRAACRPCARRCLCARRQSGLVLASQVQETSIKRIVNGSWPGEGASLLSDLGILASFCHIG
jgi:hypothetical protein